MGRGVGERLCKPRVDSGGLVGGGICYYGCQLPSNLLGFFWLFCQCRCMGWGEG